MHWMAGFPYDTNSVMDDIQNNDNNFIVQTDGYYLMQSHLQLKITRPDKQKTFIHKLVRRRYWAYETLLQRRTELGVADFSFTPSILSDILYLRHGDVISVKVSDISPIYRAVFTNTFTMYRM